MRSPLQRPWVLVLAVVSAFPAAAGEKTKKTAAGRKEAPVVQRPSWGKVIGWVLDAQTRQPIPGARVSVAIDGAFPESGKSTDLTEKDGKYEAHAPLGKVSSKVDWGRLLTMSPLSLVVSPRSATKQTKIVDMLQANVRVEAPGYQPFVGRVRAGEVDPGAFSIHLDEVWLAPAGASLISFTPERMRLEVVQSLTVTPAVAAPGEKVKVTLTAILPVTRGLKYKARLTSTAPRLVRNNQELKQEKATGAEAKEAGDPERVVFTREVTLPKKPVDTWTELGFYLERDGDTLLRRRETRALLQMVKTPEERAVAEKLAEGYAHARKAEDDDALRLYAAARSLKPDYPLAHQLSGELLLQLNRPAEAAEAFRKLVELNPRDYELARPRYAQSLFEAGRANDAMAQLTEAESVLGKRPVPARVSLTRARIFAAHGNFAEADKWLAKAGNTLQISNDTLNEINLKRMADAVQAAPENPDLRLSYARVLEGAQRKEEALAQARKAAALDPAQPWAFMDLGDLLLQLGQREEAMANLRHALKLAPENPEVLLAVADGLRQEGQYAEALPLYARVSEQQKLNLRARHFHALMLYATGQLAQARPEFTEVLAQARAKGDLRDNGIPFIGPGILGSGLYFGAKRRLVAGFSIPEATADLAIVEALEDLEQHPNNGLLWQNIGSALLDLDLPALALPALEKAQQHAPELTETRFLLGTTYRQLGRLPEARRELNAVLNANPLHPRARLELAQLHTDQGEVELAQAQLLAHSKNYPYDAPARAARTF